MYVPLITRSTFSQRFQLFDRLKNWPQLVLDAVDIIRNASGGDSTPPVHSHPVASLLCMLNRNKEDQKFLALKENILLSALGIACMAAVPYPDGMLPDMPNDVSLLPVSPGWVASFRSVYHGRFLISCRSTMDMESYTAFHVQYCERMSSDFSSGGVSGGATSGDRAPYQLFVLVSPLFCILGRKLGRKAFHRRPLLFVSSRLGPHKPPLLLEVEGVVIDAAFRLSTGMHPLAAVLLEMADKLYQLVGGGKVIPENVARWFDLDYSRFYFQLLHFPSS